MDNQKYEWDKSYQNLDNFVFYPHEEVIRFVSKFIRACHQRIKELF